MTDSTINSKAVIEAAYAYEEALDNAIEIKKLSAKGVVSSRELSTATRGVAKAKALWAGMCRDLANRLALTKEERTGNEYLAREGGISREKRVLIGTELEKNKLELQSIAETQKWVENFKTQSIDPLEKQLEQSQENKAEEKKSEAPSEPATSE